MHGSSLYVYASMYRSELQKMAPRMAAVVWNAAVLLMFLFVCSVFSHSHYQFYQRR